MPSGSPSTRRRRPNAAGIGAFLNVLNFGQMYGLHGMLLPALVTTLVAVHVVQVRLRGVVRPIEPAVRPSGPRRAEDGAPRQNGARRP